MITFGVCKTLHIVPCFGFENRISEIIRVQDYASITFLFFNFTKEAKGKVTGISIGVVEMLALHFRRDA
jgi:hypothetical protein